MPGKKNAMEEMQHLRKMNIRPTNKDEEHPHLRYAMTREQMFRLKTKGTAQP
jgi:hypothetical protein